MTRFGYFLASEEHTPNELVRQARMAEEAGFEALWISDHYHPWLAEQGESSFVWSVIAALSQKVCWAPDAAEGRRTADRLCPNDHLPGEAAQLLPLPRHFAQLSELGTEEMVGESGARGPDAERHIGALTAFVDAGYV